MTTNDNRPSRELARLLAELIDGQLSDADFIRLQELLRGNAVNQRHYDRAMTIHALLHLDFAQGVLQLLPPVLEKQPVQFAEADEDDTSAAARYPSSAQRLHENSTSPRRKRRLVSMAAALAAAAVVAIAAWRLFGPQSDPSFAAGRLAPSPPNVRREQASPSAREPLSDESVAILSQATGAVWPNAQSPADVGGSVAPGRFRLESGLIQLEFLSGAIVIVEGPAEFELESSTRMTCRLGKIRTHVPNQAHGFTVETPAYEAVDLGTEFTVQVDQHGASEFHVLDGEVELWDVRKPKRVLAETLTEGRGARVSSDGALAPIVPGADATLVGREQLQQITEAARQKQFDAWRSFSQNLRERSDIVAYFDFDGHAAWERQLHNKGPGADPTLDGAIVGCRWTTGRWPGKQALEWKRTTDRVRIDVPGAFDSLTLMAWVRIEGLERWLSSLMLSDGHELGEVHWQITETGQLLLGVKADPEFSHDFYSAEIIGRSDLRRWIFMTCVYDGPGGTVRHYLDGNQVSEEPVHLPVKLRIGRAEIGNWSPEEFGTYRVRSLNGRVDEFAVSDRPLTAEEIKAIYEAGKPGF